MPLRSVKMKRFILGFQRRVWCPKWTPLSRSWRVVTTAMAVSSPCRRAGAPTYGCRAPSLSTLPGAPCMHLPDESGPWCLPGHGVTGVRAREVRPWWTCWCPAYLPLRRRRIRARTVVHSAADHRAPSSTGAAAGRHDRGDQHHAPGVTENEGRPRRRVVGLLVVALLGLLPLVGPASATSAWAAPAGSGDDEVGTSTGGWP